MKSILEKIKIVGSTIAANKKLAFSAIFTMVLIITAVILFSIGGDKILNTGSVKDSVSELDEFKKINQVSLSKNKSIKEISVERKADLQTKIATAETSLKDNMDKQLSEASKAYSLIKGEDTKKIFLKEIEKNKAEIEKDLTILGELAGLVSGTGSLILNKDLETAIAKQINDITAKHNYVSVGSVGTITNSGTLTKGTSNLPNIGLEPGKILSGKTSVTGTGTVSGLQE